MKLKVPIIAPFSRIFSLIRAILFALMIVVVLHATGVISSISYFQHWTLINAGLQDADTLSVLEEETFDFSFSIKDLEGHRIPFKKFKGKVIFLNLWATWCGPCRAEMASIQSLYEKMDTSKVAFVMLSIDKDSDLPKVVSYVKSKKFTFQAYMPSGYLPRQLKVPSIPTTFVIGRSGKLTLKEVGSKRYDTKKFQTFLEELTEEPK